MREPDPFEIARSDVAGAQQAHVTGALAHIRTARAVGMKSVPAGPDDAAWRRAPESGDFFRGDSAEPEGMGTAFRAAFDAESVAFLVECPEPKMSELRERSGDYDPRGGGAQPGSPRGKSGRPAVWTDDSVEICLSPQNDHHGYWRFVVSSAGTREVTYSKVNVFGWKFDIRSEHEKLDIQWAASVKKEADAYLVYARVPFASMGVDPGGLASPWGFNVTRQRTPLPYCDSRWNQTFSGPHFPLNSGALCFGDEALRVTRVVFGGGNHYQVRLADNELTLTVENRSAKAFRGRARARAVQSGERKLSGAEKGFGVPARGTREVTLPFRLHYMERKENRVHIEIEGPGRSRVYSGSYGLGSDGLRPYMDYPRGKRPSPNPKPSDGRFYEKKVRHVITKLPKFVRRTTAQGAPSDFFIEAADGSVAFNLMEAGCLSRIADFIYGLYADDRDRLAGAVHFVNQPAVVNYSFANTRLATMLSPLSLMRLGGGQCCCFANTVLGLCEKMMCEATGEPYRGWRIAVPGHVMTEVLLGGKPVLLDGSAGKFYYLRDNRTLGSHAELSEEIEMVERAGGGLAQFFRGAETSRRYGTNRTAWPNGAPIE